MLKKWLSVFFLTAALSSFAMAVGTIGTDFSNSTWADGVWQTQFDYNAIDGIWVYTYAPAQLGVGFYGNPPFQDAVMEKHFVRAGGDTNYYDAVLSGTGARWNRGSDITVDYRPTSADTWSLLDSANTAGSWDPFTVKGTIKVNPSMTTLQTRFSTLDSGNWGAGMSGGGSSMSYFGVDFKQLTVAQPGTTFTDDLADTSKLYASSGITPRIIFGAPCQGVFSDSGYNYLQWGFARPEGYTGPLSANIAAQVYAETYVPGADEMTLAYSFDAATWTTIDVRDYAGGWWTPELAGTINMAGTDRLYVRVGGITAAGGTAWLGYVNNLDVQFVPEPATMILLTLGGLTALRRRV